MTMETQIMTLRESDQGDTFADPAAFAHWQRVAGMFAASEVIPQHLRGHMPDVLIGLDLARRLHLNPLSVLQNLYVVKGTPGWKTTFLIALATSAGWDLDWEVVELEPRRLKWKRRAKDGTVDAEGDNLRVRCVMERGGRRKLGLWVSTEQAIAARWADNEQYTHSTELMLRWRAAAFAIRMHDPNLLLGLPTAEEAMDETRERIVVEAPQTAPAQATTSPPRGLAAVAAALAQPAEQPDPFAGGGGEAAGKVVVDATPPGAPQRTEAPVDPVQEERTKLIAELQILAADLPEATRQALRQQHELRRISPTTADVGKLRSLVEATRRAVADRVRSDQQASQVSDDSWDGPTGSQLRDEVTHLATQIGPQEMEGLLRKLEVPAIDGAPESMLRRVLNAQLDIVAPEPGAEEG